MVDLEPVPEHPSGPSGPSEPVTAPSSPVARPIERASAPTDPQGPPPLPAYLTPPYLIGGAVLVLILGILLGKLL